MNTLQLRNMNTIFEKVNTGKRYEMFYSIERDILLVFHPYDDNTTESVCNATMSYAYDYLTKYINTHTSIVVLWLQVEGATSDFYIYHDLDVATVQQMPIRSVWKLLDDITPKNAYRSKYAIINKASEGSDFKATTFNPRPDDN